MIITLESNHLLTSIKNQVVCFNQTFILVLCFNLINASGRQRQQWSIFCTKMAIKVTILKVKSAMALYQKIGVIWSTTYVESFMALWKSAQCCQFWGLRHYTNTQYNKKTSHHCDWMAELCFHIHSQWDGNCKAFVILEENFWTIIS